MRIKYSKSGTMLPITRPVSDTHPFSNFAKGNIMAG
jgi:hypothetical protein